MVRIVSSQNLCAGELAASHGFARPSQSPRAIAFPDGCEPRVGPCFPIDAPATRLAHRPIAVAEYRPWYGRCRHFERRRRTAGLEVKEKRSRRRVLLTVGLISAAI